MSKNKSILLLVGKSGSGKSTVAEMLCKQYGMTQIQSYTTRPPRQEGESGHLFIDDHEFSKLQDLVGYTVFNGYQYGATAAQVENNDIYVIDPHGVDFFMHQYRGTKEPIVIQIEAPDDVRYERMLQRGDSPEAAEDRLENDRTAFRNCSADHVIANDDLLHTVHQIYELIKE